MMRRSAALLLGLAFALLGHLVPSDASADAPVRLSVKFILDASGNRGTASGWLVTDQDVQDQLDRANEIFGALGSEFGVEIVEILDVAGADEHFSTAIVDAIPDVLDDATSNPMLYRWRDDAINVYITGDTGGGVTYRPPTNEIMLLGQRPTTTTLAHEVGHDLDLKHTFQRGGDDCSDTIVDRDPFDQPNDTWDPDDIANENYGMTYATLSASQQTQVDRVWRNLMSYHDRNNRSYLSRCQMDRNSRSGWNDRNWMLDRLPVYVDASAGAGGNSGSWSDPFATLDEAIGGGSLDRRVLVLLPGTHSMGSVLSASDLEVVSRRGAAFVHEDPPAWDEPVDPLRSAVSAVAAAMRDVQAADRAGDLDAAIEALLRGEAAATGTERLAIQVKLAQRLRQAGRLAESLERYERVAADADDPGLRDYAAHWSERVAAARARDQKGASHEHDERGRFTDATSATTDPAGRPAPRHPARDASATGGDARRGAAEPVSSAATAPRVRGTRADALRSLDERPHTRMRATTREDREPVSAGTMAPAPPDEAPRSGLATVAGAVLAVAIAIGAWASRRRPH